MADEMETMTDATARLRADGYVDQWIAVNGSLRCGDCDELYDPADLRVDETVRFEGASDPGDESILFALSADCDHRGQFVAAYGPYTSAEEQQILRSLAR